MKFEETRWHLGAALAAVAAFHLAYREVTLKLADQVMVRADGPGFAELAAEHPFGAVDWVMRLLAASNLVWWGPFVNLAFVAAAGALAAFALRRWRTPFAPFGPWLAAALAVLPTLSLGDQVWLLPRPHFPQLQLTAFVLLAACLTAGRRGLAAFAALQVLFVIVGRLFFHDLPEAETLRAAWAMPIQFEWGACDTYGLSVFAAFVVLCLLRRPAALPRWAYAVPPVLAAVLFFCALPKRDCRDQLKMEAAVREGRFADVLGIAPKKSRPERMETAWRILAMFRTDRIDRDLYRYPIIGSHNDTLEEEMIMEGHLLLFHYGLLLPARRWTFETTAAKGWQPHHYRLLGDIALVMGEEALARKNFAEYARCPFRGDFAARRLATLDSQPRPADAFSDLADVADIFAAWQEFARMPVAPTYFADERVVERYVYTLFQSMPCCPPPMLKMAFAAALLDNRPEFIRENRDVFGKLYPDGRIGPVFLEVLRK